MNGTYTLTLIFPESTQKPIVELERLTHATFQINPLMASPLQVFVGFAAEIIMLLQTL
jgi:hypothetical protein